jgi:hypothetical protein
MKDQEYETYRAEFADTGTAHPVTPEMQEFVRKIADGGR